VQSILLGALGLGLAALVGFIAVSLCNRLRVPHPPVLIIAGMLLGVLSIKGHPLLDPPKEMLLGFSIIALCMIAFDNSSRMPQKKAGEYLQARRLTIVSILSQMVFLTPVFVFLFFPEDMISSWILAALCALLCAESSLDTISEHPTNIKQRSLRLLVMESRINTPFILLSVFLLLSIFRSLGSVTFLSPHGLNTLGYTAVTAIAVALMVGIVFFKWIKDRVTHHVGALFLFIAVMTAFILAEKMQGSGFVAVIFLGLFFGRIFVERRTMLVEFSQTIATLFEVLVFALVGFLLPAYLDSQLILGSLIAFLFFILVRYVSISIACKEFEAQERFRMALNAPLGISIAAVTFFALMTRIPFPVEAIALLILYSNLTHWAVRRHFS
jgi:potassium/hydrogen antiporter